MAHEADPPVTFAQYDPSRDSVPVDYSSRLRASTIIGQTVGRNTYAAITADNRNEKAS